MSKVVEIKYYKTALVEVDETGSPVNGNHTFVPAHPETDFMKKNKISIIIMSLILSMWFGLRLPVYRISDHADAGVSKNAAREHQQSLTYRTG